MKKKFLFPLLAAALVLVAGGIMFFNPPVDFLENDSTIIVDRNVPLTGEPDLSPSTSQDSTNEMDPYEGLDETQIEFVDEVVALVNEAREKEGLSPLVLDPSLRKAAQVRAAECVTTFSHTRPNGSSYKTAISEAGVVSNYTGENVATGHTSAKQVVNGWLNSKGHRANILNSNYTKIGVGLEKNTGNRYRGYAWAQLFAK